MENKVTEQKKEVFIMVYKCSICGYEYDEEKEGKPFSELDECPICKQPPEKFYAVESEKETPQEKVENLDLNYPKETRKTDSDYRYMKEIHEMAVTGKSAIEGDGHTDGYAKLG